MRIAQPLAKLEKELRGVSWPRAGKSTPQAEKFARVSGTLARSFPWPRLNRHLAPGCRLGLAQWHQARRRSVQRLGAV